MTGDEENFRLRSENMGCLPVLNWFLTRMGLSEHLGAYLPNDDVRLRVAPAAVIGVLVRNILVAHQPVYAIGEWANAFSPAMLAGVSGLFPAVPDLRLASGGEFLL